jgi:hypothetical protein
LQEKKSHQCYFFFIAIVSVRTDIIRRHFIMRAFCQHSVALAAVVFSCQTVTSSAFTNGPGNSGDALAFRRNRVGLFADNNEGEEMEEAGELDTQKDQGRKHDMTDRFKYKVNALMGTYNPQNRADDERQDGNILEGESQNRKILASGRPKICSHSNFPHHCSDA